MNAVDRYAENIEEIAKDCDTIFIRSMTYDIESLIEAHLAKDSLQFSMVSK